jgi:hypothetical protein
MHDLERLRFVTERYPHLQGLRIVPLGIPFLISTSWRLGQFHWVPGTAGAGATRWFAALMALATLAGLVAGRYYRRRFGSLQPTRSVRRPLLAAAFVVLLALSVWTQLQFNPPLLLPVLAIGLALSHIGTAGGQVRFHYLLVAAGAIIFASLGSFGVPLPVRDVLLDQLVAFGFIVIGLGDHFLLERTLEPAPRVTAI